VNAKHDEFPLADLHQKWGSALARVGRNRVVNRKPLFVYLQQPLRAGETVLKDCLLVFLHARLELDLRVAAQSELAVFVDLQSGVVAKRYPLFDVRHSSFQLQQSVVIPHFWTVQELLRDIGFDDSVEVIKPAVLLGEEAQLPGLLILLDDKHVMGAGEHQVGRDEQTGACFDGPESGEDLYETDETEGLFLHFLLSNLVELFDALESGDLVVVDLVFLLDLSDANLLEFLHCYQSYYEIDISDLNLFATWNNLKNIGTKKNGEGRRPPYQNND
jgi:hypothetical protein